MTIDPTKITAEKLAEMNDSLIVDNNHLRDALAKARDEIANLEAWQADAFEVHPNLDMGIDHIRR